MGPSPKWMQQRLKDGLRPINALVDITNYVTFDQGHVRCMSSTRPRSRAI